MSLISWLSPKPVPGLVSAPSGSRKAERLEQRERLYGVVRDAMTRAGVLSSSYKFKVLSLDSRGSNYLVMMDLASAVAEDNGRLSEIETLVAHNARSRFDIHVTAVYWRLSDHVTTGLASRVAARAPLGATQYGELN
jgi:hypothetical protein